MFFYVFLFASTTLQFDSALFSFMIIAESTEITWTVWDSEHMQCSQWNNTRERKTKNKKRVWTTGTYISLSESNRALVAIVVVFILNTCDCKQFRCSQLDHDQLVSMCISLSLSFNFSRPQILFATWLYEWVPSFGIFFPFSRSVLYFFCVHSSLAVRIRAGEEKNFNIRTFFRSKVQLYENKGFTNKFWRFIWTKRIGKKTTFVIVTASRGTFVRHWNNDEKKMARKMSHWHSFHFFNEINSHTNCNAKIHFFLASHKRIQFNGIDCILY